MAITAAQVKELRERTGLGMMDCKKALTEADGDMEKAVDLLRKKGLKTAEKRAGRETKNGWIGLQSSDDGRATAMVDLACETDFVSKGDDFQALLGKLASHALVHGPASVDEMLGQALEGGGKVADALQDAVGRIGEKIELRHVARFDVDQTGAIASYLHHNGQVGVVVKGTVEGGPKDAAALTELLEQVTKHIAALAPMVVRPEDLPADLVEKEREIYAEQVKDKPEKIRANIVEGMIRKRLFAERTLLEQAWVFDDKLSVAKAIEQASGKIGGKVVIEGFARFKVGEDD
jgi:elongation factor Ts